MADTWKGKALTIAGKAAALIEVSITRTIVVDADFYERFSNVLNNTSGDFEPSGLTQVVEFYKLVEQLPPEARRFAIVPWTDADSKKIGLRPFSSIVNFFEDKSYFRVEGTADTGFIGYFNLGGQDQKIDLSQNGIPIFKDKLVKTKQEVLDAFNTGQLTLQQKEPIDEMIDLMEGKLPALEALYRAKADRERERREEERRRMEQEARDRENRLTNEGEYRGDFETSFGRDFGDIA